MRPVQYPRHLANSESARRRRGLKGESEGEESPADPEAGEENPPGNEQKIEAVEPLEEPDPSARDEFHQAYTKKLEAADKDLEDYARTLDSVSYPVSARVSHSDTTKPSHWFVCARPCYAQPLSFFSSIANPTVVRRVSPSPGLT